MRIQSGVDTLDGYINDIKQYYYQLHLQYKFESESFTFVKTIGLVYAVLLVSMFSTFKMFGGKLNIDSDITDRYFILLVILIALVIGGFWSRSYRKIRKYRQELVTNKDKLKEHGFKVCYRVLGEASDRLHIVTNNESGTDYVPIKFTSARDFKGYDEVFHIKNKLFLH
jgi:hypothetical protein